MDRLPVVLLIAAVAIAAGCSGSKGSAGNNGLPGPTGTQGPPGPITAPPQIDQVLPALGGAAGNTWYLEGKNFSSQLAGNIVSFDGYIATVTSASPTQLTVVNAFPNSLANPTWYSSGWIYPTITVSVEVANQVSNGVAVEIYPDGFVTYQPFAIFDQADKIALTNTTIYILSSDQDAIYAVDRTTHTVAPVSTGGVYPTNVFVGPAETLYVVAQGSGSGGAVWQILTPDASGALAEFAEFSQPVQSMTFDAGGNLYFLFSGTNPSVTKVAPGGSILWSVTLSGVNLMGSLVNQGNTLYAIQVEPLVGGVKQQILTFQDATGALGALAVGPTRANMSGLMAGDGQGHLFVADSDNGGQGEISQLTLTAQNTTAAAVSFAQTVMRDPVTRTAFYYPGFTGMALDAAKSEIYLVGGNSFRSLDEQYWIYNARIIRLDSVGNPLLEASGLSAPNDVAYLSNGSLLVADSGSCFTTDAPGAPVVGALFTFTGRGAFDSLSTAECPYGTLRLNAGTPVIANFLTDTLESIDLKSGAATTVATLSAALSTAYGLAIDSGTGDYYVFGASAAHAGSIARVTAAGVVSPDFAYGNRSAFLSGTVVGSTLVAADRGSFQTAPLAGGGQTVALSPSQVNVAVVFGAMVPDGKGGFYAADAVTSQIFDVGMDGSMVPMGVLYDAVTGLDRDPYGDLLIARYGLDVMLP